MKQPAPDLSILQPRHVEQLRSIEFDFNVKEITVEEFMLLETAKKQKMMTPLVAPKIQEEKLNAKCLEQTFSEAKQMYESTILKTFIKYAQPEHLPPINPTISNEEKLSPNARYRKLLENPEMFRKFKLAFEKKIQANPEIARPALQQLKDFLQNKDVSESNEK